MAALKSGRPAEGVLGQCDLYSDQSGRSDSRMSAPSGLALDRNGGLWVADEENARILRFDPEAARVGIANADGVLGAPTLDGYSGSSRSRSTMHRSEAAWTDVEGSIWVADIENHRLLRFTPDTPVISSAELTADGRLKLGYEVEGGIDYEVQSYTERIHDGSRIAAARKLPRSRVGGADGLRGTRLPVF